MLIPTVGMGVLAVALVWIGYHRGQGQHAAGLKAGWDMTLVTLPMLVLAFVTGWATWAVTRLPLEIGILGWRLTLARLVSTFSFPPLAGFIAQALFGKAA